MRLNFFFYVELDVLFPIVVVVVDLLIIILIVIVIVVVELVVELVELVEQRTSRVTTGVPAGERPPPSPAGAAAVAWSILDHSAFSVDARAAVWGICCEPYRHVGAGHPVE